MEKLFYCLLFHFFCVEVFGMILLHPQKEQVKPHYCNKKLANNASELPPLSLYYIHHLHDYEYEKAESSRLCIEFEAQRMWSRFKQCPFKWIENIKENRIPRMIMAAECEKSCDKCESIKYILPVLVIDHYKKGFSVYRQEMETIAIAFVPKSLQSNGPSTMHSDLSPSSLRAHLPIYNQSTDLPTFNRSTDLSSYNQSMNLFSSSQSTVKVQSSSSESTDKAQSYSSENTVKVQSFFRQSTDLPHYTNNKQLNNLVISRNNKSFKDLDLIRRRANSVEIESLD